MKYIPSIFFAIIEIVVVWMIVDTAQYTANSVVIASLALIYATIRGSMISVGVMVDRLTVAFASELLQIKKKLGADESTQEETEKLQEANKKVNSTHIKLIIRSVGVFIIFIGALLYLIG